MYKKTISYTNYSNEKVTKEFHFNLTRPELVEMKRSPLYEMQAIIERVKKMDDPDKELSYSEKDDIQERMGDILRNLVIQSFGYVSDDGERFVKRIGDRKFGAGEEFVETMAYDALYMEMISDVSNMVNFVRAIVPPEAQIKIDELPSDLTDIDNIVSMQ